MNAGEINNTGQGKAPGSRRKKQFMAKESTQQQEKETPLGKRKHPGAGERHHRGQEKAPRSRRNKPHREREST